MESNFEINSCIAGEELREVQNLINVRELNNEAAWLLCDYLNDSPRAVSAELFATIGDCGLDEPTAFAALVAGFCGLDVEENRRDALMFEFYLRKAVRKLDVETYLQNPYYKNVKIPNVTFGNWCLESETYAAYEAFICDDLCLCDDFREIPQIGFFDKPFSFPVVKEDGREWMAIKPSEIESMKKPVEMVAGKVVTFGLGLGYFAYMASLKDEVEQVTVVERDEKVIGLFEKYILPQFSFAQKVRVVKSDAFEFVEKCMHDGVYDYAFVDLWHDASDGLPLYLKMKSLESEFVRTKFLYWVENTLVSAWRWNNFETVLKGKSCYDDIAQALRECKC